MPDPTIAYQSYQDAKKRGDELEAVRLWVEYLDAVRNGMDEKAGQQEALSGEDQDH